MTFYVLTYHNQVIPITWLILIHQSSYELKLHIIIVEVRQLPNISSAVSNTSLESITSNSSNNHP